MEISRGGGAEPNKQPLSWRILQRLLLFVGDRSVHIIIVLRLETYFYITCFFSSLFYSYFFLFNL